MNSENQPHRPVLLNEVIRALQPATKKTFIDGTLGAGGHAEAILEASAPDGTLIGFDVDPEAIAIASRRLQPFGQRIRIIHDSYASAAKHFENRESFNGILLDLGVSSMQVDEPERGFSFLKDGPLDMRFGQKGTLSAREIVNEWQEAEIADILWTYGEERASRKIAAAICAARTQQPIETTAALAAVIASAVRSPSWKIHPATKSFQAIRIAVNSELDTLKSALPELVQLLKPGGRLAIISFHSLEDRIVKQFFKQESTGCLCPPQQMICTCGHKASLRILTNHAVIAEEDEIQGNSRARSAKLRVAEKIGTENEN